ncbi:MAG: hypothetical protein ACJ8AT_02760 [Hyalangium sp.]|uniref:hypothetical protein n=1 Tax=Hyalangium sp. TaxID=2028555 RepID=UPI00389AB0A2
MGCSSGAHSTGSQPVPLRYDDASDGFLCVCPQDNEFHTCDHRTQIDGSVVFVTSACQKEP